MLAADAMLGIVGSVLVLAEAVLLARVIARSFDGAPLADVVGSLVALALVIVGRGAATWAFEVVGRRAAGSVQSRLRFDLVEHRLRRHPAALDGVQSAEVATLAVSGVDALEAMFARYLPQVILAVTVPLAVIAVVIAIDPLSAAVMLLTLPLVPVFMWLIGRYTERRTRERWDALARLSSHFLDVVRGLPTLRAFNRGRVQAARIEEVSDAYRVATMRTLRVSFLSGAVLELAATLGIALVAVTVGIRLVEGGLAFEAGLTVLILAPELYLPLRNLGAQYHASADGRAVTGRLLELIEGSASTAEGRAVPPDPRAATIRFEGVSFAYPVRAAQVLDGIDLAIDPGEIVALVGPSGGGKSTLAAITLKLVDPSQGRVTVGAVDLADLEPGAWRATIAWVPQRPTLFRATVADNIRLGAPDAPEVRVRQAAALAGADGFIEALPEGLETVVGDGGRRLSAGQTQRIAVARAFLRDASLLVLDEPTANLDPRSAAIVGASIADQRGRRSILLIAHSPELAAIADRVVRIDGGRIAAADPSEMLSGVER
jgi:ATP-binding cassette, subfamily C, bacterial CydD